MINNPLVSIIIPTRNSGKTLRECLKSIKEQTYKNIEIIIVDQHSIDETSQIVKLFHVKLLSVPEPKFYSPPSASRNFGAKIARGEILYHMDSDMRIEKGLISEAVGIFQKNNEIGAIIVHEKDLVKGYWSKCRALERRCYWWNDNIESARIVRKDIFNKVGGYDKNVSSGEDFLIHRSYRKYSKIAFCNNILYHDLRDFDLKTAIIKKFNYGKTALIYFKKNNSSGLSFLSAEIGCYLRNYKLFLKNPFAALGMIFLKSSELLAGGIGFVYSQIKGSNYLFHEKY